MAKMIIMQGLPASGKSTVAQELLKLGGTVRINKDLLRTMLHFDKFTHKNEAHTHSASRMLAQMFLNNQINVIIDDTNLNPRILQGWKDLAKEMNAKIEYHRLDTSPEECMARDAVREKKVGDHVIQRMALQYRDYLKGQNVVICDLDGTLCDCEHRRHLTKGEQKDWKAFFEGIPNDTVRQHVLDELLKLESEGNKIIFVSARPDNYRESTEAWLEKTFKGYKLGTALIMRDSHDQRPDVEVKSDIYDKYLSKMNIVKVFDDRPSVIRMWREKGLTVEDVGNGEEF